MLRWIAEQVSAAPSSLQGYAERDQTRREHFIQLLNEYGSGRVVGFPDEVRYFPRDPGDIRLLTKEFVDSWKREKAYLHRQDLPPTSYLAISGGGDNGAFTAGFLNSWTKAGTRPQFKLVTGVSTGALIAPFAFLGPAYDETLKSI